MLSIFPAKYNVGNLHVSNTLQFALLFKFGFEVSSALLSKVAFRTYFAQAFVFPVEFHEKILFQIKLLLFSLKFTNLSQLLESHFQVKYLLCMGCFTGLPCLPHMKNACQKYFVGFCFGVGDGGGGAVSLASHVEASSSIRRFF